MILLTLLQLLEVYQCKNLKILSNLKFVHKFREETRKFCYWHWGYDTKKLTQLGACLLLPTQENQTLSEFVFEFIFEFGFFSPLVHKKQILFSV